ncbi:MAG: MFS transporter, partial [Chloroflexi bacterium]|nr:MFS transporter [Chloroflexota bacterium]
CAPTDGRRMDSGERISSAPAPAPVQRGGHLCYTYTGLSECGSEEDSIIRKPFYGWYIVAVAMVGMFVGAGSAGFAFSVFLPAMVADEGWSRSTLVGATSFGWIAASLAGPWIGRIIDRRGARLMLALSVLAAGIASVGSGFVQQPWQFYLTFGLLNGIARTTLITVAPTAMIGNWFIRRRSLAFSIAALGPPMAGLVFPPLTASIIAAFGWRIAWMSLGVGAIALGLAPVLLFVRRRPEDMGLMPDGDPSVAAAPLSLGLDQLPALASAVAQDWTFQEALHSPGFWGLAVAMALIQLSPGTISIFIFSSFRDQGISDTVAAGTISVLSLVQVVSRIAFWTPALTWLGSMQRVVLLWAALLLGSTLFLSMARGEAMAYAAAAFIGLAWGGNLVVQLQIWPEFFGRTAVGAITGVAQLLSGLGAAGGPLLGAVLLDATGSYRMLYYSVAGIVLVGFLVQLMVGRPQRRARSAASVSG